MLHGLAKRLTNKFGPDWVKGLEYIYLGFGAVGILISAARLQFLSGRFEDFEKTDIIAPLFLMTAIVIRFIKTRADIGNWHELK
jgi:hypothetical protein